ncbi:MAG: hypothetical protein DCC49_03315 [Acidobacteria bacterium]|nr:MAG: hypothetical protein DCC49_03315 [Acidobacteriota bacterium]
MRIHEDESAITELSSWWTEHSRDDFGPFGLPEWIEAYRRSFGGDSELCILEIDRSDVSRTAGTIDSDPKGDNIEEPVALIPMEMYPGGLLRFAGGTEVTDYAGPVCADEDVPAAATGLARWLSDNRSSWSTCSFEAVPEDIGFGKALVDELDRLGITASREAREICAVLDVPSDFESYLAGLSKKERHELRRKRNRFAREAGEPELVAARPEELDGDLELFFDWHRQAQGAKGGFMDGQMEVFFTDVAKTFTESGLMRLEFVEADGKRFAASFGFSSRGRRFLYNSAFLQEARALSPGMVMIWLMLEEGLREGVAQLDFLQGDERYKFQLGARVRGLESIEIRQ